MIAVLPYNLSGSPKAIFQNYLAEHLVFSNFFCWIRKEICKLSNDTKISKFGVFAFVFFFFSIKEKQEKKPVILASNEIISNSQLTEFCVRYVKAIWTNL